MKLGFITVGQSPRDDVLGDMAPLLGTGAEILEAGALDGLTLAQVRMLEPKESDGYVLVSRMRDGTPVRFAEKYILPRLQDCIFRLEEQGAEQIVFLCTGEFPPAFQSRRPVIYPGPVLRNTAAALCGGNGSLLVLTPDSLQLPQMKTKWAGIAGNVEGLAISPFAPKEAFLRIAEEARDINASLAVMDCISYGEQARRVFRDAWGRPVLLARTLLARVLAELV
ncbi:MAG: AroM family protein [Clostridiaceae bacterium]|nr:AroM family protein [Clostridiaceae bacterium]